MDAPRTKVHQPAPAAISAVTAPAPTFTAAPWLKVPWSQLSHAAQRRAEQWQSALLMAMERSGRPGVSRADVIQMGVDGTARVFGQARSARHVRRMLDRVEQRDAVRREWHHVELFVEDAPAAVPLRATGSASAFDALADSITGFTNAAAPTVKEESSFLLSAWREEQGLRLRGAAPKKARAQLLAFLWERCPWLSETRCGLENKIRRKFSGYEKSEGKPDALLDGRAARLGESRAPEMPTEHLGRLTWLTAKKFGGRVQFAVDELIETGEAVGMPAAFTEFLLQHRSASGDINRRLLDAVRPEVEMLQPYLLGRKAIDDATAPLRRCYDKLRSMTVVNADDFTMPVYCWLPDGTITRGQVLIFIDIRSRRVLHYTLLPTRSYDSLAIRSCMTAVCRAFGVPPVWLYERGIWESSKIVKAVAPLNWRVARSPEEASFGWEQFGSRFIHAIRARSKPVEKVGDLLQRLMEDQPGYCGRDERRDCPEETKRAKLAVEARRDHPSKHFLSFDQWHARLGLIIKRYNAKPQHGLLAGLSPDEAFKAHWPHDDPPTPLDARCWHLGAHYVRKFTVGDSGITFKFGKQTFAYFDEQLSSLRHREVLAWFDSAQPECIAVTLPDDRDGKAARFVSRVADVDFLATLDPESPEAENYRQQIAKQQGFNSHAKARFQTLQADFKPTFRTVVTDRHTAAMAEALKQGRDDATAKQRDDSTRRRQIQSGARQLGIAAVVGEGDAAELEGMRMMQEAAQAMEEEP